MEQVKDETLFWYGKWPEVSADGVRCASWKRDRLGYLSMDPALGKATGTVMSCPINLQGKSVKLSLNVDGVGEKSGAVKVEMLTESFKPLPSYGGENAALVQEAGLRQPVVWGSSGKM